MRNYEWRTQGGSLVSGAVSSFLYPGPLVLTVVLTVPTTEHREGKEEGIMATSCYFRCQCVRTYPTRLIVCCKYICPFHFSHSIKSIDSPFPFKQLQMYIIRWRHKNYPYLISLNSTKNQVLFYIIIFVLYCTFPRQIRLSWRTCSRVHVGVGIFNQSSQNVLVS